MNKKRLKQLREAGRKGGMTTKEKHGPSYYSDISKKATKAQFGGTTKEERSEMMRCVRMKQFGWRWDKEKKKCLNLGVDFSSNISK